MINNARVTRDCPICGNIMVTRTQQIRSDDEPDSLFTMCIEHGPVVYFIDKLLSSSIPYINHPWKNANEPDLMLEQQERLLKSRVITMGRFRKHYR